MRVLHFPKQQKPSGSSTSLPAAGAPDPIRIYGILHDPNDQARLRQIAEESSWDVLTSDSLNDPIVQLEEHPVPIVIYDRDFPGANWKDSLARIASLSSTPCVLLASAVMDPYLWDEVIRHRGYDIVHKPFDALELRRVVRFAASWRQWMSEYHSRASGGPTA
jgi:DNA-binding NtrC family response regulator